MCHLDSIHDGDLANILKNTLHVLKILIYFTENIKMSKSKKVHFIYFMFHVHTCLWIALLLRMLLYSMFIF